MARDVYPRSARWAAACALALCVWVAAGGATEIYEDGEIICDLVMGGSIDEVNQTWGTTTIDSYPEAGLFLLFAADVGDLEAFADSLMTDPNVAEAEANYIEDTPEGIRQMVFVAVGGTISDYEDQAIGERIGLAEAHQLANGNGVMVAVVDTGIDPTHEALAARISPNGYDFIDGDPEPWEEANGIDDDQDELIDESYGHGTMVAGIIALVAPGATILPVRALDDEGRGDAWTVVRAIRYAIEQGADVVNMSFGVPRSVSSIGHQIRYGEELGVVMVAGAGNENRDHPAYYPAIDSKVMMVTALDSLDIKADFADYNSGVTVSAPGTGVRSAYPGNDWALGNGCSFAAPFVTGEVALILSAFGGLNREATEDRVELAVDPIDHLPGNGPFEGELGTGRLYLPLAVDGATTSLPATLQPAPALLLARPNPVRAGDLVHFDRIAPSGVSHVDIFDVSGRAVRTLEGRGGRASTWDARDARGRRVPAGVYFIEMRTADSVFHGSVRVLR